MQTLELKRSYLDNGTFGKITYNGKFLSYTVERPWLSNTPMTSCIPPGVYAIKPYSSEKYPDCFALENENLGVTVRGEKGSIRSHILIHVANFVHEVKGCIGPGLGLHPSRWGVMNSRKAMDNFRSTISTSNADWELIIT